MMKQEFERMCMSEVSDEAYDMIETVYMNYPGITEKQQVIEMYKRHGIVIFCDLYSRSMSISEKESRINSLKKDIEDLKNGRR